MKICRGAAVYLNSVLYRGEWPVLCSGRFVPVEKTNYALWMGLYGASIAGLCTVKLKQYVPFSEIEPQIPSLPPCSLVPTLTELP